jgi:hypothetical protein
MQRVRLMQLGDLLNTTAEHLGEIVFFLGPMLRFVKYLNILNIF